MQKAAEFGTAWYLMGVVSCDYNRITTVILQNRLVKLPSSEKKANELI